MPHFVIDNKKVEMTNDEHNLFQRIVKSYTFGNNDGETLFQDLFEVDGDGIIQFLRPPSKRQTSFEVFLFLMALQQQQHIRQMYRQVEDLAKEVKEKLKEK
jgi:hypothetical protein